MKRISLLICFYCISIGIQAASFTDSLSIRLREADSIFLTNNLALLSQRYNISAEKAMIIQARLWPNPLLHVEQVLYNPGRKEWLAINNYGQQMIQIQQMIQLAGKRNKRINMQTIQAEMAEYEFFDLLRTLHYQLHSTFYEVYYLQQSARMYQNEISSLTKTVKLYEEQYQKNNIPLKEIVRLKAFLFSLENEYKELLIRVYDVQAELHLLLNLSNKPYIIPQLDKDYLSSIQITALNPVTLEDSAMTNRSDLHLMEANSRYAQSNLALQRSLAVPDLNAGAVWDRGANYIPNYYGLTLEISLPAFNRNQGNIKAAQFQTDVARTDLEYYTLNIETDVNSAYLQLLEAEKLFRQYELGFNKEFDQLIDGILINYEKRNISLIEFIDFYESYKNHVVLYNRLSGDRMKAIENINYTTGSSFFILD